VSVEEIKTEDQLRTWIVSNLGASSAHLQPLCSITRVGEAWVVAPPPGNIGMSILIIAADGSIAKTQETASPVYPLEEVILSGAWKTNDILALTYPEPAQLLFHEDPLFQDSSWMQKLAEMERESLE